MKILDKLISAISFVFLLSTFTFISFIFAVIFIIGLIVILITIPFKIGRKNA